MELKRIKPLKIISKRGQIINTVTGVIMGLFILILLAFAIFLGISSLNPGSFFAGGTPSHNAINGSIDNLTTGFAQFTEQIPTVFTVLGVVLVLGALAILILIVVRFRSTAGASGGL